MAVFNPVVGPTSDLLLVGVSKLLHRRTVGAQTIRRDRVGLSVALERLLHKGERCLLITRFCNVALEDFAFLIDRSPEVYHLAVELHVQLVEVPTPVAEDSHPRHPVAAYVAGKHRSELVPPHPDRLVADIDPALEQQVLDVSQRQRETHVHHHYQPDHLELK